jgi:ribosomal protein S18 acetylase RimI-like enzyme
MSAPATSAPPAFSGPRHEIASARGAAPFIAQPMTEADAGPLAEAVSVLEPWRSYDYPAAKLADYLARHEPGALRFVLHYDGKLAGGMGLRLNWMRGPYVQFLAVLPPFQCQGLGSALLDWVEAQSRAVGERNLWIAASEINTHARRLYERLGFREVATLDDLVCDGRAEVLYRKRLA